MIRADTPPGCVELSAEFIVYMVNHGPTPLPPPPQPVVRTPSKPTPKRRKK